MANNDDLSVPMTPEERDYKLNAFMAKTIKEIAEAAIKAVADKIKTNDELK